MSTSKRAVALMMLLSLTALMLLTSGCASANKNAVCDGTLKLRDAHASALLTDGGDKTVVTGASLIAAIDAACGDV